MRIIPLVVMFLLMPLAAFPATIKVPQDYGTIQEAIDAAGTGDLILVDKGTYKENIDFKGKAVTVQSAIGHKKTIIDGQHLGSVVTFKTFETEMSVLDGFTIRKGTDIGHGGGGIYCVASSPTIINNRIMNNAVMSFGGGIYLENASPRIQNNQIKPARHVPIQTQLLEHIGIHMVNHLSVEMV